MSSRSYLSIGDVLTLLRQEFPDVTISKIRFLESQGLVNPERTPSGYRKFYDHDVERLRWVLRQQREHFLPLKVIKDRLDDPGGADVADVGVAGVGVADVGVAEVATEGVASDDAVAATAPAIVEPAESVAQRAAADGAATEAAVAGALAGSGQVAEVGRRAEEPALVGQRATAERGVAAVDPGAAGGVARPRAGDGPMLPGIETAPTAGSDRAASVPATATASSPNASSAGSVSVSSSPRLPAERPGAASSEERSVPAGTASAQAGHTAHTANGGTSASSSSRRAKAPTGDGGEPSHSAPPPSPASASASAPAAAPTGSSKAAAASKGAAASESSESTGSGGPAPATPPVGGGVSMSADELSAASGLEVTVLAELQEYGLLSPMTVAGLEYFDEEALVVATAAARFAQFGIEPRHLRLYKNAADREAGFVEQIVLPLVRQRNPEARARAHETVDELALLGQQLRGALLRGALSDLLNS